MELKVVISVFCDRYWVTEMHVDGFRFDLASIMTRGSRLSAKTSIQNLFDLVEFIVEINYFLTLYFLFFFVGSLWDAVNVYGKPIEGDFLTTGSPLSSPPLLDMISNDPILHGVKVFTVDSFLILPCKSYSHVNIHLYLFEKRSVDIQGHVKMIILFKV